MKSSTKYKRTYLFKIAGLLAVFSILSACHSLPVHHSGHGNYESHSSSRDYQSYNKHYGNSSDHSKKFTSVSGYH